MTTMMTISEYMYTSSPLQGWLQLEKCCHEHEKSLIKMLIICMVAITSQFSPCINNTRI